MIYRSKTNNKLRVLLGLSGIISLLWLPSSITRTIALSPARRYMSAPTTTQGLGTRANGKIAFSSSRNGYSTSLSDIYAMDADGSNQRQLTFTQNLCGYFQAAYAGNPVWSPDGKKVAFGGEFECGHPKLYVMNADHKSVWRGAQPEHHYLVARWQEAGVRPRLRLLTGRSCVPNRHLYGEYRWNRCYEINC